MVEAKLEVHTLTGLEAQSGKYDVGPPDNLPCYMRPLPFLYEGTGVETRFCNGLDPWQSSRSVFSFHTPASLAEWLGASLHSWDAARPQLAGAHTVDTDSRSLRSRFTEMPSSDRVQRPHPVVAAEWHLLRPERQGERATLPPKAGYRVAVDAEFLDLRPLGQQ